uniref:Flagellar associated protein n=1 Tax=Tetraselmis sp. GSL018 TaxID=582737 RepID=A0A061RG67_9CHLO|mmetsp:Transcript_30753/g.73226  ORF Transcript_30753/g.73226 Transcript_30753/m.73226 type:complete len:156 (+) Transcript_30753:219-686(+)
MAKEFGSKCDMISASLDEVSRNCIWREHVRKEKLGFQMNTDFRISDPNKMQVITEKPNRVVPQQRPDSETMRACTQKLESLCSSTQRDTAPNRKYTLPVTSTQVYGFWSDHIFDGTHSMFDHKRHAVDVSKYADSYVTMTGKSPFSRTQDFSPSS